MASAEYIEAQFIAAGYAPVRQEFSYPKAVVDVAAFTETAPRPTDYAYGADFYPMDYTGKGDVTARSHPGRHQPGRRPGLGTSGCEADDFTGFTSREYRPDPARLL